MHIDVKTGKSNALHEYLQDISGSKIGLNETSADESFYEFRLGNSMSTYFH